MFLFALLPVVGVRRGDRLTISYGIALAVMLRCLWRLPGHDADIPESPERSSIRAPEVKRVMPISRRCIIMAADLACRVLGRHRILRAARCVLYRARLDVPNDLATNGEKDLQRWVANLWPPEPRSM